MFQLDVITDGMQEIVDTFDNEFDGFAELEVIAKRERALRDSLSTYAETCVRLIDLDDDFIVGSDYIAAKW